MVKKVGINQDHEIVVPDQTNTSSTVVEQGDYQEDEDIKMERFYQLIRQYREVRDHQRRLLQDGSKSMPTVSNKFYDQEDDDEDQKKKMKKIKVGDHHANDHLDDNGQPVGWVPAFKWEDFMHVGDCSNDCILLKEDGKKKRKMISVDDSMNDSNSQPRRRRSGGIGLDLNLSL